MTPDSKCASTPDGAPPREQAKWRRDFPIGSGDDASVARRDFSRFLLLTSAAFVAGQLWIAAQNLVRKTRGRPPIREVANLADIPIGATISFQYPDEHSPCILSRLDDDVVVAFDQRCSHLACAVIPKVDEGRLVCPCHKGFFDAASGVPLAGPPRRPLPRIQLDIRGGVIYAIGVELRV